MVSLSIYITWMTIILTLLAGSRGPAVLDDFTASYGYKFSDAAGYRWPMANEENL